MKNISTYTSIALALLALSTLNSQLSTAHAQGTAFTYQGQLENGGSPASGNFDLKFTLFDAITNGNTVAGPVTNAAVAVTNGLFTTAVDFGSAFDGNLYWLRIQVRTNGGNAFANLSPRQQLTPTPYAEFATTASNLSGTISLAQLPAMVVTNNENNLALTGTFSGNGTGLTNVNAVTLNGLAAGHFWQLGGNNVSGGKFIGSTNNQPVEIWAGGERAMRLEPNSIKGAPNVIGGTALNAVSSSAVAATIAGGGASNYSGFSYINSVTADFGTVGGGGNNSADNEATVAGGFGNTASGTQSVVGGGSGNTASAASSLVSGGSDNTASANFSLVGGGFLNSATAASSTVVGGFFNFATKQYAFAGGGQDNIASGNSATVSGGLSNVVSGFAATISGGQFNSATANSAVVTGGDLNTAAIAYSTVGGGYDNIASGQYGIIAGGNNNSATATSSAVGGGYNNSAGGQNSAIGGGGGNITGGFGATIGGGWINAANFDYATVAGGQYNLANGTNSFVGGGLSNTATNNSTVGGGIYNQAFGISSTIGGGFGNFALDYSVVGGGSANSAEALAATVGGGQENFASGQYATVPGGLQNGAVGANSFAAGNLAVANYQNSFVWSDGYYGSVFQDTGPFQFLIHAAGGVGINVNSFSGEALSIDGGATRLNNNLIYFRASPDVNHGIGYFGGARTFASVSLDGPVLFGYAGGALGTEQNGAEHIAVQWSTTSVSVNGTFNNNSDRNAKENFATVAPAEILDKVAKLPLSEWSYKTDAATRHIGPMAQDFYSVFNIGSDDKHIAPIDEGGLAFAAIQGLNEKVESGKQKAETQMEKLEAENAELKARLEKLEQMINARSRSGR